MTSFFVLFFSPHHTWMVTFSRNGKWEQESSCISDLSAISHAFSSQKEVRLRPFTSKVHRERNLIFIFFYCPLLISNLFLINLNDLYLWICYHITLPSVTHHSGELKSEEVCRYAWVWVSKCACERNVRVSAKLMCLKAREKKISVIWAWAKLLEGERPGQSASTWGFKC